MIQEEGLVVERVGLTAKVAIRRGKNCASCRLCAPTDKETMVIHAHNTIQAEVGEKVRLEISTGDALRAGVWVYILPLSGLILGLIVGHYLFCSEMALLLCGLTGLFLSYLLACIHDKKIRARGYLPSRIIEVIKEVE